MRRQIVLVGLVLFGAFSIGGWGTAGADAGSLGHKGPEARDNLFVLNALAGGGGGNTVGLRHGDRRGGRRHEEPGLGPAAARGDQDAHAEARDADHQHPYARRSRERKRRVPADGGRRDPREHQDQHGGDAAGGVRGAAGRWPAAEHLHPEQRHRDAEAHLQGLDDDRPGCRAHRAALLRARAHRRRRDGVLSRGARAAHGRRVCRPRVCRAWTPTTAAPASGSPTR